MRNPGTGIYELPNPDVVPNTTISSTVENSTLADIEQDLNFPRPIVAGGTGATSAAAARTNLQAERSMQQITTTYTSHTFETGSFFSAAVAGLGAPVDGHAFLGVAIVGDANNIVLRAYDQNDTVVPGRVYTREKKAGVWSAWSIDPGTAAIRYDIPQSLTTAQQSQARQNLSAAPIDVLAYSGIQVNGSMEVAQEFGLSVTQNITSGGARVCDIWQLFGTPAHTMSGAQVSGQPGLGGNAPRNVIQFTSTVGSASIGAGDAIQASQSVEASRISRLYMGTSIAQPITVAFLINSTAGGTMGVTLRNGANNRSCVQPVTVTGGNAWEYKVVTFPGDTAGTWPANGSDTGRGLILTLTFAAGTTLRTATLGTWQAGVFIAPNTIGNFFTANGNTIWFGAVMILPGIQAPLAAELVYVQRDFATELAAVKRYYNKTYSYATTLGTATNLGYRNGYVLATTATATEGLWTPYEVIMRAAPTIVFYNDNTGAIGTWRGFGVGIGLVPAISVAPIVPSEKNFLVQPSGMTGLTVGQMVEIWGHYTADARL